jgi:hypothetical protein
VTQGIGASGILGIALETVIGTYTAPTKYVPFMTESLKYEQATQYRRPIRNTPGIVGAVMGNSTCSGDVSMEALTDCMPYFMYCSRAAVIKSGGGPYTYTATPNALGVPTQTLSITLVRNGVVFGYTGISISQFTLTVSSDGKLMYNVSLVGLEEASESVPVPAWPTSVPFGAGMYNVQIPTAAQIFDADTFEFTVNDNGSAEHRLKNTSRGPQFTRWGEREVTFKTERDFETRAEYDAFKAGTSQGITVTCTQDSNNEITFASPVALKNTYEVNLGGQGDLVRASVEYMNMINGSGVDYTLSVKTETENIT